MFFEAEIIDSVFCVSRLAYMYIYIYTYSHLIHVSERVDIDFRWFCRRCRAETLLLWSLEVPVEICLLAIWFREQWDGNPKLNTSKRCMDNDLMIYCMIFDMIWVDIFASNRASPSVVLQPGFAEAQHERHLYDPDSSPPCGGNVSGLRRFVCTSKKCFARLQENAWDQIPFRASASCSQTIDGLFLVLQRSLKFLVKLVPGITNIWWRYPNQSNVWIRPIHLHRQVVLTGNTTHQPSIWYCPKRTGTTPKPNVLENQAPVKVAINWDANFKSFGQAYTIILHIAGDILIMFPWFPHLVFGFLQNSTLEPSHPYGFPSPSVFPSWAGSCQTAASPGRFRAAGAVWLARGWGPWSKVGHAHIGGWSYHH